jgi:hypothetical protein
MAKLPRCKKGFLIKALKSEPLIVSIEYALNEKRARELFDAVVKENVKKGWEKV